MLIGFDVFGLDSGAVFSDTVYHPSYYRVEMTGGLVDEIYIEENITLTDSTDKPTGWSTATVLDAKFRGDLEGGSITAGGSQIDRIRFQRRLSNELSWNTVAETSYSSGENLLYEAIDKYVQAGLAYQYCMIPVTNSIPGGRSLANDVTAAFGSVFLSDAVSNYRLHYDLEHDAIEHISPSSTLEPLGAQYPMVIHSVLDYRRLGIKSTVVSDASVTSGTLDVRRDKATREQLMAFLKNRKPKVFRSPNGDTILISIVDNPKEEPQGRIKGIAKVSFSMVEIGGTDTETLSRLGLIVGLTEVF